MRIFGISLYVIIAVFFAVHAVRSQQNMYWLLILFLFPGLGSAVYFFVIYLPSLRQSRGARTATRNRTTSGPTTSARESRLRTTVALVWNTRLPHQVAVSMPTC